MTAADMEALFQPIPFGETGYESPLTQVTAPDISPIWDLFRNINEDRQARTLQVRAPSYDLTIQAQEHDLQMEESRHHELLFAQMRRFDMMHFSVHRHSRA